MIIQNKKTKQSHTITSEEWDKMKAMDIDRRFKVLDASDRKQENKIPVEVIEFVEKYKNISDMNAKDAIAKIHTMSPEEVNGLTDTRITVQRAINEKLEEYGL